MADDSGQICDIVKKKVSFKSSSVLVNMWQTKWIMMSNYNDLRIRYDKFSRILYN